MRRESTTLRLSLVRRVGRILFALEGAVFGALLVALAEAREVAAAVGPTHAPPMGSIIAAEMGVVAPFALALGAVVCVASLILEPARPIALAERVAAMRAKPVLARCHAAALAPLGIFSATGWIIVTAQLARSALSRHGPMAAGVALATTSLATLVAFGALTFALLPPLRRTLAAAASRWPRAIDPATTGAGALALAFLALTFGAFVGDTGGGGATPLAILGVLRRPELDLRPLVDALAIAVFAWQTPIAFAGRRLRALPCVVAVACVFATLGLTAYEARALNRQPNVARIVESQAPLGRIVLAFARKVTDRDHDGASPLFGGGDCDDRDPNTSPFAVDVPGNGVDEDCSGADSTEAPAPSPGRAAVVDPGVRAPDGRYNLIFITVDTLRATETGFLGYAKPTTPNLDALASNAVVFERAYALASYTGKALAPMMIGKYPSETHRDGGHFTKYFAENVFVAERFRAAGVFTMGAASHWYFRDSYGLTQGFDAFDLSALPKTGQGETDTSVTSPALTEAAERLLDAHAATRFFMWVHYFDPHAQYVPHGEAPDFADAARAGGTRTRALYDGEIWFTDKSIGHLLDYVSAHPWGKNTIIVVTSDHGEAMNEHGIAYQHGFELWEPLMRIPLVIRVPGVLPRRVRVKRSAIDVVPTLLDLMRMPATQVGELSGESLLADLLGTRAADEERDVYMDMPDGPFTHMRRSIIHGETPGTKLIHFGGRQFQLYDLLGDPGETNDLANDPARFGPMHAAFQAKRATLREVIVKSDAPPNAP